MHDPLLAAILDDPSDDAHWAVFIDRLIARGDPRGELAVASDPEPLLRSLAPAWLGLEQPRVSGGRVIVGGDSEDPFPSESWVGLEFERGHVRRMEIDIVNDALADGGPEWGAAWIPALVGRILSQPVGQLIETIEIRQRPDWGGDLRCDALLDALVAAPPLALRSFAWGYADDWEFVELPDCAGLLRAALRLETVTLQGEGGLGVGLQHPRLRTLGIGATQPESLEGFAGHELPALEHLTVWLEFDDTREVDSEFELERLAPLIEASLPRLRTLALPRCPEAEKVREALREASWFAQLERLTLE